MANAEDNTSLPPSQKQTANGHLASRPQKPRLLVINPNTTQLMTEGLESSITALPESINFEITYYTAPSGPASINNQHDCDRSASVVIKDLMPHIQNYDAFLVACYSVHPLVPELQRVKSGSLVAGIFESSIGMAKNLAKSGTTFGIVTTGQYWVENLTNGVRATLGDLKGFAGVESTGLNANELHSAEQEDVKKRVKDATKRLLKNGDCDCTVICLGCAGMTGMDSWVREAISDELATGVRIIDGVQAALAHLAAGVTALDSNNYITQRVTLS